MLNANHFSKKKKGLTEHTANPLYSFGAEAGI